LEHFITTFSKIIARHHWYGESEENICSDNTSLYTVQEALVDPSTICENIPNDGVARLGGGSAMYGADKQCMIVDVVRTNLTQALCGSLPRN